MSAILKSKIKEMQTYAKLENYFKLVQYTSPCPLKYKIIITDPKISSVKLDDLHIMSSSHFLFIEICKSYPLFKVNVDKIIKVKDFKASIQQNILEIQIIELNESDLLEEFKQQHIQKIQKKFIDIMLQRIYSKYVYKNSIMFYINKLKKTGLNFLSYNVKFNKNLNEFNFRMIKIYFNSFKSILKSQRENKIKHKFFENKRCQMFSAKIFLRKIRRTIKERQENLSKNLIAKLFYKKICIQKLFHSIGLIKDNYTKLEILSMQFYNSNIKEKIMSKFKELIWKKHDILNRVQSYNKVNIQFIIFILEKLNMKNELKQIYQQEIRKIFNILKDNANKRMLISYNFSIIIKNYVKLLQAKEFRKIIKIKQSFNAFYLIRTHDFFRKCMYKVCISKIIQSKISIYNYHERQKVIQIFFQNIVENLSHRLKRIQGDQLWKKRQCKFRLIEFLLGLQFAKNLDKVKIFNSNISLRNSFKIVSYKRTLENKKKIYKILQMKKVLYKLKLSVFNRKKANVINQNYLYIQKHNFLRNADFLIKYIEKSLIINKNKTYYKLISMKIVLNEMNEEIIYEKWEKNSTEKLKQFKAKLFLKNLKNDIKIYKDYKLNDQNIILSLRKMFKAYLFIKYLINCYNINQNLKDFLKWKRNVTITRNFYLLRDYISKAKVIKGLQSIYKKNLLIKMFNITNIQRNLNNKINLIQKKNARKYFFNKCKDVYQKKKNFNAMKLFSTKKFYYNIYIRRLKDEYELMKKNEVIKSIYFKCLFIHSIQYKINYRYMLKARFEHFIKKISLNKIKKIAELRLKSKEININYKKLLLKNYIVVPSKIHKLINSIKAFDIKFLFYFKFLFLNVLILNKKKLIFEKKIIKVEAKRFFKVVKFKGIITNTYKKSIDKFKKKHMFQQFLSNILINIKNNINEDKKRQLVIKEFLRKVLMQYINRNSKEYQNKEIKIQNLTKYFISLHIKNNYKIFIYKINDIINYRKINNKSKIYSTNLNFRIYTKFFTRVKNEIKNTFINNSLEKYKNDKMLIIYKVFFSNIKQIIINRKLNLKVNKFILKQTYLSFHNISLNTLRINTNLNNKIKEFNWENNKNLNEVKDLFMKKFLRNFIKYTKNDIHQKMILKKKIFNFLKDNVKNSKDINHYLQEAELINQN